MITVKELEACVNICEYAVCSDTLSFEELNIVNPKYPLELGTNGSPFLLNSLNQFSFNNLVEYVPDVNIH